MSKEEYRNGQVIHNKDIEITEEMVDRKLAELADEFYKKILDSNNMMADYVDNKFMIWKLIIGSILLILAGLGIGLIIGVFK